MGTPGIDGCAVDGCGDAIGLGGCVANANRGRAHIDRLDGGGDLRPRAIQSVQQGFECLTVGNVDITGEPPTMSAPPKLDDLKKVSTCFVEGTLWSSLSACGTSQMSS